MHRVIHRPAGGKARELRQLLSDRALSRQAEGFRVNAYSVIYGTDAPEMVIQFEFEHLADLQRLSDMARGEATPFFDSVAAVSSGSQRMELWEIALASLNGQPTPPAAPPKFVSVTHFTPGVGLAGELRRVLVENAREGQAAEVRLSVLASMSGPNRLDVVRLYADLAELEAARLAPPTAEALRRVLRATPLMGAVVAASIVEIVVPFPAR